MWNWCKENFQFRLANYSLHCKEGDKHCLTLDPFHIEVFQRFSRAGPRGRGREWATLAVHPLSWLLSNNRLEEVCSTLTKGTFSSRLLLSNQVKGCSPSVAHSLPLPLGPALLNLSIYAEHVLSLMFACPNINSWNLELKKKKKKKKPCEL